MSISDEIIIMKKGVVAQMGSPKDIYYCLLYTSRCV